jgi:hypothetical protein
MLNWHRMTKVELQYDLVRKLEDADAEAVARVHGYFGVLKVKIASSLDKITVDYDASRLSRRDLEGALVSYGVPIRRTA